MPSSPTKLKQKLGLIFLGTLTALLLAEASLRLAGAAFLLFQDANNRKNLSQSNLIRILCIGESTTALGGNFSYPAQLEQILNRQGKNNKFKVINEGIPATESTFHAARLHRLLNQYKPHIVVTMLGINDKGEMRNTTRPLITDSLFQNMRLLKLFNFIRTGFQNRTSVSNEEKIEASLKTIEEQIQKNPNPKDYFLLYGHYRTIQRFEEAKQALLRSLELDPNNCLGWASLGLEYKHLMEFAKATEAFTAMLKFCPPDQPAERLFAYAHLGSAYFTLKEYDKAIAIYRETLKYFPQDSSALGELGKVYLELERYTDAEEILERQIRLHPKNPLYYGLLAKCYQKTKNDSAILALFENGLVANPQTPAVYLDYAIYFLERKRFTEAQGILHKALKIKRENYTDYYWQAALSHLLAAYEGQGESKKAEDLRKKFLTNYALNQQTQVNYQKIKETLEAENVKWLAVQYPLRDTASLKAALPLSSIITFVDNQKSFADAVSKSSYYEYFTDRFAGDFGHCTAKGNQLLAQNIAEAILKIYGAPRL